MGVVDRDKGERIAQEWLDAFNAHDARRVVAHFSETVTDLSPVIDSVVPGSGGRLEGRDRVLAYYEAGIGRTPELHFTLIEVLCGIDQVTILYRNQQGTTVAETLTFGPDDDVIQVSVTYGATPR